MNRCSISLYVGILFVTVFSLPALASTWAITYPPTGNGTGIGQVIFPVGSNGDVIIAGEANTHGFIARVNSAGQYVWQHAYGASATSHFYGGCDIGDGYLLCGSLLNGGVSSVWVMKINTNGDSLWSRTYGGNLASEGYAIKPLFDAFIVVGKNAVTGRGDDGLILYCHANGDTIWTKKMGGTGDDRFSRIVYPDTSYYPGSDLVIIGSKTINAASDIWITRVSDSGNVVWDSTYGGSYNDDGQDIAFTDYIVRLSPNFDSAFPPNGWTIGNPDSGITWTSCFTNPYWARLPCSIDSARGQTDSLFTPSITTTGLHSAEYVFEWSYAAGHTATNNDGLEFAYSTDNGTAWNTLWYRHAQDTLSLVAGLTATDTTPSTFTRGVARISLPNGVLNQPSVRFAFIGHNDNGPDIFITNNLLYSNTYLSVGYSNSVTGSPNNKNLYLKKIDQLGRNIWTHDYGVAPNEYGHRLLLNTDGTFYVIGTSNSTDSQEGGSISLWKCSATGDTLWQRTYGNSYNCIGRGIAINSNRDIYITGGAGTAANTQKLILMKLDSNAALTPTISMAPFANSYFRVGDTTTFRWQENMPGVVRLEMNRTYPSDTWTTLIANTTADSFRWVVTSPVAPTCRMRVTLTGFGDSTTVMSDSTFAIVQPTVHIVAPNGGEMWPVSSAQTISWSSQYLTNERIIISLQRATGLPTVLDTTSVHNGSMNWTVVTPTSNACRVVMALLGSVTPANDQSDTTFQIVNRLHITHPTQNQAIQVGVNDTTRWISSNVPDSIIVELKRNYPSGTWEVLGITNHNPGYFVWQPNLPLSGNTAIRISNYPALTLRDTSAMFQILRPTIAVTYPNGSEHLRPGSVQDIQWNSSNVTGFVRIELNRNYPDSTNSWETLFDSTANDGEQLWSVNNPSTVHARMRITSIYNPTVSDTCDNNFEIIDTTNAVSEVLPKSFQLGAYPNPFNSQVRIGYLLDRTSNITIAIYDVSGREVYLSAQKSLSQGFHTFEWNAGTSGISAGIYYCRIQGTGASQLFKVVYLK